ncbi:MAG: hypothetical protein MJK18_13475, partial [Bdellovibrionales bacterium]|nr:hypothetical protein [Bdellovibrionales bacterium]
MLRIFLFFTITFSIHSTYGNSSMLQTVGITGTGDQQEHTVTRRPGDHHPPIVTAPRRTRSADIPTMVGDGHPNAPTDGPVPFDEACHYGGECQQPQPTVSCAATPNHPDCLDGGATIQRERGGTNNGNTGNTEVVNRDEPAAADEETGPTPACENALAQTRSCSQVPRVQA